uniref:Uncharacterized protein n=1 Tax=Romanomermis culicivorax TaxID=13658 RepID=A0A915KVE2_ROMCU
MQTEQRNPKSTQCIADVIIKLLRAGGNPSKAEVGLDARGMLGTLLMASRIGKSPCKSAKLDDQWPKHLHRNGVPKKDQKIILVSNITERLERRAKGPGASFLTASSGRPVTGSRK